MSIDSATVMMGLGIKFERTVAHVTEHPDGTVNFNEKRNGVPLKNAILKNKDDYTPAPSGLLKLFMTKVREPIE